MSSRTRKPKKVPPPPIDWEAVRRFRVVLMDDTPPPRRLKIPKRPPPCVSRKLAEAEWSWSPCHSMSGCFWFAEEINNYAVLWLGEEDRTHCNVVAVGVFGKNVPARHSSWLLLEKYLNREKTRSNMERPQELNQGWGPLKEADLEIILEMVWPEEDETDC